MPDNVKAMFVTSNEKPFTRIHAYRCSVIKLVCHSFRTLTGTETRMSIGDKSYSRAWCDEADLTHITLWSSCCSSCSDSGSIALADGVESTSWQRRLISTDRWAIYD